MNKQIAIYGAIDRFNYGDLLFEIILYEMLKETKEYSIDYYALCKSNMKSFGGKPTRSIQDLFAENNLGNGSIVIIAGGEVLGATWFKLHRYILPQYMSFSLRVMAKLLKTSFLDRISQKAFDSQLQFPFVLSPDDFLSDVKIIYNAVGGSSLSVHSSSHQQHVISKLKKAAHLSVRDNESVQLLTQETPLDIQLRPDSACLMSEIFPFEKLQSMISQETQNMIDQCVSGYLCFQASDDHARDDIALISEQLTLISKKTGFTILLLPIGRAAGHEDQKPLMKIKSSLQVPCILPSENSVFDIMALISKARVFAGTSLHGCITAMSFAVPYIGMTNRVPKLEAYLQTWAVPELSTCKPYEMLESAVDHALTISKEKLEAFSQQYIQESKKDFAQIRKQIE